MIQILRFALLRPIIKPLARFAAGCIAIPIFRLVVKRGFRLAKVELEIEEDLEQWFRAILILLVATANMEHYLFGWLPPDVLGTDSWIAVFLRLLLAIGVIELMPDQALFGLIHTSSTGLKFERGILLKLWRGRVKWLKKLACVHLNRSSPVFLMMSAIFGGVPGSTSWTVGWTCYGIAITQYLIILIITSTYKGGDVVALFDQVIAKKRQEIEEEFHLDDESSEKEEELISSAADSAVPARQP